jgi:hypothetical protein
MHACLIALIWHAVAMCHGALVAEQHCVQSRMMVMIILHDKCTHMHTVERFHQASLDWLMPKTKASGPLFPAWHASLHSTLALKIGTQGCMYATAPFCSSSICHCRQKAFCRPPFPSLHPGCPCPPEYLGISAGRFEPSVPAWLQRHHCSLHGRHLQIKNNSLMLVYANKKTNSPATVLVT